MNASVCFYGVYTTDFYCISKKMSLRRRRCLRLVQRHIICRSSRTRAAIKRSDTGEVKSFQVASSSRKNKISAPRLIQVVSRVEYNVARRFRLLDAAHLRDNIYFFSLDLKQPRHIFYSNLPMIRVDKDVNLLF